MKLAREVVTRLEARAARRRRARDVGPMIALTVLCSSALLIELALVCGMLIAR